MNKISVLLSILMSVLLTACGGSGGSDPSGGPGGNSDSVYAAIQIVTDQGTSAYSNEIVVPTNSTQINVSWDQSNKAIDGTCFSSTGANVQNYIVNLGSESGQYSFTETVSASGVCSDQGKSNECGTILSCSYSLDSTLL